MASTSPIMYVERIDHGGRTQWARIGRVRSSKSGKTCYYRGRELLGVGRPWYLDVETRETFFIQAARKDGLDRSQGRMRGSFRVEIDDDVREEYWEQIRDEPKRSHERFIYS